MSGSSVYCVKCKGKTGTSGAHMTSTRGHKRIAGRCTSCGSKKSGFVRSGAGMCMSRGGKGFGDFFRKAVDIGKSIYDNPLAKKAIDFAARKGQEAAMKKWGGGRVRRRRGRGIIPVGGPRKGGAYRY